MTPDTSGGRNLSPITVTVKTAADMLGITSYRVIELCRAGAVDSRLEDGRILVDADSLRSYVETLPRAVSA